MRDVPSIDELRSEYVLPPGIDLQAIIRARWMDNHPAPNGTDELLAWLLILINVCESVKQERDALLDDKITIHMNEATGDIIVTSTKGDYDIEKIVGDAFSKMLATVLSVQNGGEHWSAKVRMIPDHDTPLPFD